MGGDRGQRQSPSQSTTSALETHPPVRWWAATMEQTKTAAPVPSLLWITDLKLMWKGQQTFPPLWPWKILFGGRGRNKNKSATVRAIRNISSSRIEVLLLGEGYSGVEKEMYKILGLKILPQFKEVLLHQEGGGKLLPKTLHRKQAEFGCWEQKLQECWQCTIQRPRFIGPA